ncbi:MAG: phosphoribosyl-AMP cyclohydrolase [Pseudomonadota bacterium]
MISEDDLSAARAAWGEGLVAIAMAFEADGIDGARRVAGDVLDAAYGYTLGPVLFKPTLSGGPQTFRTTRKGALSYFVGHDPEYPDDNGFAIQGWREVRSETAASFIEGDVAMWMGWVYFTNKDGQTTKVDKTFGYKKDADGVMRLVLHHSSLPYAS